MNNPAAAKAAVPDLVARSLEAGVRFPLHWVEDGEQKEIKKTLLTMLLSCHKEDGSGYDVDECLQQVIEKYGIKEAAASSSATKKKKRADEDGSGSGAAEEGAASPSPDEKAKKIPKKEVMACEENRAAASCLQEIADLYWKQKDSFKGATYSKAAKALRECETFCSTSKEACKLKGIGKGCGAIVDEVLKTGKCDKLEKLRAGEF